MSNDFSLGEVQVSLSPKERFEEFLQSRGKRTTQQRRTLVDFIFERHDHFNADELWVDRASGPVSRVHLAFQAADRAQVDRFHAAALAAGGRDNGAPGERPYHPGYYGAFVFDPDGNNIEAVFHGPAHKSAESVVITPA